MARLLPAAAVILVAAAAPAADAPADSLLVDLPDIVVSGTAAPAATFDRTVLAGDALARLDAGSLAAIGAVLPSSRVTVNSRGDAVPMVRGASERHVQTFLDGIPLNLPWDERVDLETVPALGIGRVEGRRGPATLLDGPGALAGSLRLLPPVAVDEVRTRVRGSFGSESATLAEAVHQRRLGAWQTMAAGAWQKRDALPLAGGDGPRFNSDLEQGALLLRGARPLAGTGSLSLLATAWTAEKGVPPEMHLGDEARFWRYPVRERMLAGAALEVPLDAQGTWDLGATVSFDAFHQEIDPRGPDGWDQPLEDGQDYEKNWDRTGYGRLRLERWLGDHARMALQGSARYTHHRETTAVGDPVLAYAQWLTSVAAEGEAVMDETWTLRAGLGWDHGATPEAGDKASSPAKDAVALNLRVVRSLGERTSVFAGAGRRSRFPSLRETYSGALGRFIPNPELGPERQDQVEAGAAARSAHWSLEGAAFASRITGGIERQAIPGTNQFERVNRSEVRVPGVEVIGAWTPRPEVEARLQHTILDARVEDEGVERPAEDRPAYLSLVGVSWQADRGPGAGLEARVTGPRWSADSTAATGVRRLPAGVTWNVRLAWRWPGGVGSTSDVEAWLRLDNAFDTRVDDQTGLPGPGRTLVGGLTLVL
ncbi:MAG TPA: TonB-dependent receptor [Candidatus Krumholzibacteria bacterium]|nr:TonB-dependent receptor [Candidatus Krumholzibacteria bacterium]